MRETWTFHSAGSIVFGPGAAGQLGDLTTRMGLRRMLIVTDGALAKAGVLDAVRRPLTAAGITLDVFDGGEPEPTVALAERCIAYARRFSPDSVLGLGGGSNMDLAKVAATVLAHGGAIADHLADDQLAGPVLPLVCVPTTAGTGSEVSGSAVVTDEAKQLKVSILSQHLRPRLAVVDPRLTLSCPRKVTADSGIDALTHAIEAFTAVDNADFPLGPGERTIYQGRHPLGEALAEKAIVLVGQHLVRAVERPDDLEARTGMALAAMLGGLAFSNIGVALVHALEYPVGGATHCSHGEGNGLLLPYVMRYHKELRQREFARIAQLLGRDVSGLNDAEAAEQAIVAVDELKRRIGIPARLRELGARQDQLRTFAEKAITIKRILRVNPRVPTVDELESILQAAW